MLRKKKNVEKEKECWKRKRMLSHIWVKSESDLDQILTKSLTSFNQSWYACNNALHSYILINKLFEHLKEIYDELNRNWKCHHEYNTLKQAEKSFNVFYFNFIKLFNYLKYNDCILMNDLQNKINNCLQNALSVCSENFTLLTYLKIFL